MSPALQSMTGVLIGFSLFWLGWLVAYCFHRFGCPHDWDLVDRIDFPSVLEETAKRYPEQKVVLGASDLRKATQKRTYLAVRCKGRCGRFRLEKLQSWGE